MRHHIGILPLIAVFVFSGSTAFASSDTGTLAVSTHILRCNGTIAIVGRGFINGEFGSYSPTGLNGGDTVGGLFDEYNTCGFPTSSWFEVDGFSSDPGSTWLTSVTCGSVEKTASTAGYSYASGVAAWEWSTQFGFSSGNVSCTIVHN